MPNPTRLIAALLFLLPVACAGPGRFVQKGMDAYVRGDFADADQRFTELEADEADMNPKGFVRYKVYRGLTRIRLGDTAAGCPHLRQGAEALARGDSAWIPENIKAEMSEQLAACGAP